MALHRIPTLLEELVDLNRIESQASSDAEGSEFPSIDHLVDLPARDP
jgi:hypothetical protein